MNAFPGAADLAYERESRTAIVWLTLTGLAIVFIAALAVRWALIGTPGLTGDLDQFVLWAHGIATRPLGHAYDLDVAFPPVMVYVWAGLAAIEPLFRTVTTSADEHVRTLMKLPSLVADLTIGGVTAWHLRATPRWAVLAVALVVLHPAVLDVSAWWGQYDSIYVAFGVIAFVLAVRGHSVAAAGVLAMAVMSKPQALPFVVPFGAWFLARDGFAGALRAAVVGAVVVLALWLPFIPAGGVQGYARNLAVYQGDVFAILSLRAWNVWWLVQELLAGGSFVADTGRVAGPITLRHVGYGLAVIGELVVFALVYRARTPRALALGVAASALVAFCLLTSMHERYAFAALAFLPLAFPARRALALTAAFGVTFTLNLLAAIPPTPQIGAALPVGGLLGVAGSVAMLAILAATLVLLHREDDRPESLRLAPRAV